jgi:hypothetical protein
MDGAPDILHIIDLDGKKPDPVFFGKSGEGFVLPLDDQEIRFERRDLLSVRVDEPAYLREYQGFWGVCTEGTDTHDSVAHTERKNDFGDARGRTDDPPHFSLRSVTTRS